MELRARAVFRDARRFAESKQMTLDEHTRMCDGGGGMMDCGDVLRLRVF